MYIHRLTIYNKLKHLSMVWAVIFSSKTLEKKEKLTKKMFAFSFLFVLQKFSKEENLDKTKTKIAKFNITSFEPQTIGGKGGDLVTLTVDKNLSSLVFCKFGSKEIQGRKISDFTVSCVAPRLQETEILVSVSESKSKWSLPVKILVVQESNSSSVSFILIILFVLVGIGFSANSIFGKKKRRKGHKKRRTKKNVLGEPLDGKKRAKKRKQTTMI